MAETRTEHDSMGPVEVPADALWGAQTQRAVENFPVSGERLDRRIIIALARIKGAAATVNAALDDVDVDEAVGGAIAEAAAELARGDHLGNFPVDVFQTGSGTSTNMNMNEVLARLASERLGRPVHPNDHVNASQSSNDVMPSAMHLAVVATIAGETMPALGLLADSLHAKAEQFATVVKAGRTHLMDATPVTLGQEFAGYEAQVRLGLERLAGCLPRTGRLALGGTATGTGLNAPPDFARRVIARLQTETGLPIDAAANRFEAQSARDGLVEASGALRTVAMSLFKIANDLRWMGSGPATGLGEIRIPDLQPGSSIMPGKVNPVIPESVCQVAARVFGNDASVAFAGAQGNFELNVMIPVMGQAVVESAALLANVAALLARRCVDGIEADEQRCLRNAESTPALATALNPLVGYEAAAEIVKQALAEGRTVKEVTAERGIADPQRLDEVLDVQGMTEGGLR